MEFQYSATNTYTAEIDIERVGNCCIEANDALGMYYYLIVKTDNGVTKVVEYGPTTKEDFMLPKSVSCIFKRIDYTDKKVEKIVNSFLNDTFKNIFQARETTMEEALACCPDIIAYAKRGLK